MPTMPTFRTRSPLVTALCLLSLAACANPGGQTSPITGSGYQPWPAPDAARSTALDEIVASHQGDPARNRRFSVWIGNATGPALYEWQGSVSRPGASAIKTAFLVELFAANAGNLDGPLAGTPEIVLDGDHPAIVHFSPAQQEEIRKELGAATVRDIGDHMIRGTRVSNVVYNAAANVTTAVFGGPEGLTQAIHKRIPGARELVVRRYMLAPRDVTGDNTTTARALAAVLQPIADRRIPGVDTATMESIRRVMHFDTSQWLGEHYYKSGALDTQPQARLRSGWFEKDGRCMVYVVMAEQPMPETGADAASDDMGRAVEACANELVALLQKPR